MYIKDNIYGMYGIREKSLGMKIRMWRTYNKMFSCELKGVCRFQSNADQIGFRIMYIMFNIKEHILQADFPYLIVFYAPMKYVYLIAMIIKRNMHEEFFQRFAILNQL